MVHKPVPRLLLPLLLLLNLSLTLALNNPGSKRGHLNRRSLQSPELVRSLFDPSSNPPLSSDSSPNLRRTSSSPAILSSPDSFKTALDSVEWSPVSSVSDSSHRSIGAFGPIDHPSESKATSEQPRWDPLAYYQPSPSRSIGTPERVSGDLVLFKPQSRRVWGDGKASGSSSAIKKTPLKAQVDSQAQQNAPSVDETIPRTTLRDRVLFQPQHKKILDQVGKQPLPGDIPESSTAHSTTLSPPGVSPSSRTALVAASLKDGEVDTFLTSPANAHIKEAISQLPPDRSHYQLVSMPDPVATGGSVLYRFYNKPNHALYRERVDYIAPDVQPASPPTGWKGNLATIRDKISTRIAPVNQKLKIALIDTKDRYARYKNKDLIDYYTTGGTPTVNGQEDNTVGMLIPADARRAAQRFGEARVFFDHNRPTKQVRIVYVGNHPGETGAGPEEFKAFSVSPERALPLPRELRPEVLQRTPVRTTENVPSRAMRWKEWVKNANGWLKVRPAAVAQQVGGWRQRLGGAVKKGWGRVTGVVQGGNAREVVRPVRR